MKKGEENKLWFKAKLFGWGWTPCSFEGWAVLLLYLNAIIYQLLLIDSHSYSVSDTLINFSLPFVSLTIFLLIICYLKGERARWRW